MKDFENYQKEQCTIDMNRANLVAIKYMVIFAVLFCVPYYVLWGFKSKDIIGDLGIVFNALIPFLILIAGVILHELVHGFFFALYAAKGIKSVKFGIMRKYLAPYAHCKEPLKIKNYIVALLAPLILVGILPGIAGIIVGNFQLTLFGVALSAGAAGDLMIYNMIRKENPEDYVQDHPTEAGYFIYRKI